MTIHRPGRGTAQSAADPERPIAARSGRHGQLEAIRGAVRPHRPGRGHRHHRLAADTLAIGARADGIAFVCHSHKTRLEALQHATRSVQQAGIRLVGIRLNRMKRWHSPSYDVEYYGAHYGAQPAAPAASHPAPATPHAGAG